MRNPDVYKLSKFETNSDNHRIIKIDKYSTYDEFDDSYVNIEDDKSKNKYVESIKKHIRSSHEYKNFILFLKQKINLNNCAYYNRYNSNIKGISIEIHHSPFTLYDLIYIVINKCLMNNIELNINNISKMVMEDHYNGIIGVLPLSPTVHELVHNGKFFIPIYYVFGDIGKYYEKYKYCMTSDQIDLLKMVIEMSLELSDINKPKILTSKFTYLEIDGITLPSMIA